MKNRKPYHIWGQDGEHITHLRQGSVRLGRTLRAAAAIGKYMQASVFVAHQSTEGGSPDGAAPKPEHERHYPSEIPTLALQQARNRKQAKNYQRVDFTEIESRIINELVGR